MAKKNVNANTSTNNNITKELRKNTICLIKDTVNDKKFRKEIIGQVKKLDYNQPEKKLAYILLSNNLIRVYVRAFCGLQRPNYFFQWLHDDYNEISDISKATSKMFEILNSRHRDEFALMDGQCLADMIDTVSDGQIAAIRQKKERHTEMTDTYNKEVKLYLQDLKNEIKRIDAEKRKLEKVINNK